MVTCKSATLLLFLPLTASANKLRGAAHSSSSTATAINPPHTAKLQNVFTPAMPLEDFRNIDPDVFEWVNPDEIQPGNVTCGFLKAPLGEAEGVVYPMVKVYTCVRFADNQPAPKGNVAGHCGGPGASPQCLLKTYDPMNNAALAVDYDDKDTIRDLAKVYKARNLGCWEYPGFQMKVEAGVYNNVTTDEITFHFLEHSGTRQVVEDIERVRIAFGDQRLSVYGISYGTKVMGLYATIFSDKVNLMVLDGNDDPNVDIVSNAIDIARSMDQRIDFLLPRANNTPRVVLLTT
eukprot:g3505.t1 g3505   contig12:2208116-2209547(+)